MEKYREDYIALILSDAGSIHEVTLGHVEDLKYMQAGRIVLDKFEATVQDFEYWGAKDQLSSVEYDSQSRRVLVKSVEGSSLYGFPNSCLHAYMETMACKLSSLTSASSLSGESNYTNVGRTAYDLSGPYVGDRKEADQAVAILDKGYPIVVLEYGFNDATEDLFKSAKKWLDGSDEVVRGVILVDIKTKRPIEETQYDESGKTLTWGMSDSELSQTEYPYDEGKLVVHVTEWYEENGAKLFERAVATIYLCRKGRDPERYWKCEFTDQTADSEIYAPDALFTPEELLQGKVTGAHELAGSPGDKIEIPLELFTEHLQNALSGQARDHVKLMIELKLEELDRKAAEALEESR